MREIRPSGSRSYDKKFTMPAATSGCANWINSARTPPNSAEISPTIDQVTEFGPNNPGSPACCKVAASGFDPWLNGSSTARWIRLLRGSITLTMRVNHDGGGTPRS